MDRTTEHNLIRKAQRGDGQAIEALVRGHQDALYAFMLRMSRRPEVAEDIVQEAFVRVLRNLDRFDTRFRFSTWLFTIAKRLYVNARQKLAPTFDTDCLSQQRDRAPQAGSATASAETISNIRNVIDSALEGLNDPQRQIILLFHQQNWPISEIAIHLGMPEGTVKSHLHRGRRRMRDLILADEVLSRHASEAWT